MYRLVWKIRITLFIGALVCAASFTSGCASRYAIKSYPEGATVFVRDVVTNEKKLVGKTPLSLKKTAEMGDVFFITLEKDNFFPKNVLMTPRAGEKLTIEVTMDPMADGKGKAGEGEGEGEGQGQDDQKQKMEDMELRMALLENTVALYKEALFSGRYSGGMASYDRDKVDRIIDNLHESQKMILVKKYNEALAAVDEALLLDEYVPQAHLIKGSIYYLNKQYRQAKSSWERALKIDPYNAQAYQYLRLVSAKVGAPQPPQRPSLLRAPASAPFAKSLRDEFTGAGQPKKKAPTP